MREVSKCFFKKTLLKLQHDELSEDLHVGISLPEYFQEGYGIGIPALRYVQFGQSDQGIVRGRIDLEDVHIHFLGLFFVSQQLVDLAEIEVCRQEIRAYIDDVTKSLLCAVKILCTETCLREGVEYHGVVGTPEEALQRFPCSGEIRHDDLEICKE